MQSELLTFRLFVEDKFLMDFKAIKPINNFFRIKIKDDVLVCYYKYIDKFIIDMIWNCDQYIPLSVQIGICPEQEDNLSPLIDKLTRSAPDFRFLYFDSKKKEEYLVDFEFDNRGKIGGLKLIKLVVIDSTEQDVQTFDNRIAALKEKQKQLEESTVECTQETEKILQQTEDIKKKEIILSSQTEEFNQKIGEMKLRISQIPKHEDTLRELIIEKENLTKMLSNITKEQALKRKDTLDSLAKRYETLKSDMMGELNKSLNEYIESEKKQKASLKQHMQKQNQLDNLCRII